MRFAAAYAALCILLSLSGHQPAQAVDPFVVDDARVNEPGQCQLEAFGQSHRRDTERSTGLTLGCTPTAFFLPSEFSIGMGRSDLGDSGVDKSLGLQWKMLFNPLDEAKPGRWGYGLSLGSSREQPAGSTAEWNPYFNLLGGVPLVADRLIMHANLGAVRERLARSTRRTWGVGLQWSVYERWSAIAEHYKDDFARPSSQLGLRYALLPDRLEVDVLTGSQPGETRRTWTSLGLRLFF